jgi:hypothetical protein
VMCVTSMVGEFYGRTVPNPIVVPQPIPWPTGAPLGLPWDREAFDMLKDIMARLDKLDKKLGLGECEDVEKTKWMKGIEERLKKVEKAKK